MSIQLDRTVMTISARHDMVNLMEAMLRWRFRTRYDDFNELITAQIQAKEDAYNLAFRQGMADDETIHTQWKKAKERCKDQCRREGREGDEMARMFSNIDEEYTEILRDRRRMHRELQVTKGHEYRRAVRQRRIVLAAVLLSCIFRRREQLHRYKTFDALHVSEESGRNSELLSRRRVASCGGLSLWSEPAGGG